MGWAASFLNEDSSYLSRGAVPYDPLAANWRVEMGFDGIKFQVPCTLRFNEAGAVQSPRTGLSNFRRNYPTRVIAALRLNYPVDLSVGNDVLKSTGTHDHTKRAI